jgi:hypothetical protein
VRVCVCACSPSFTFVPDIFTCLTSIRHALSQGTPNRSSKQSAKKSAKASTDETVPYWITQLTPKQLIAQLREYGSDKVAPCTASTRGLLELRLSKLIWADVDKPNDSDAGEDEDEDEDEEPPAKVVPTPRASARKRVSQKKARPAAAATEDPLGDAHLMSDDDSAAAPKKAAPTMAVATPHAKLKADHDGTLLCNMFLVAVIVILVIAILVATLD